MSNLAELLRIEERENLWQAEIDGLHLWAAIRTTVLSERLYRTFGHSRPAKSRRAIGPLLAPSKWSGYSAFARDLFLKRAARYSTLIFKDISTRLGDTDRVYAPFFELLPRPLVMETNFTSARPRLGKIGNAEVYTEDVMRGWVLLRGRFHPVNSHQRSRIREFAHNIGHLYRLEDQSAALAVRIAHFYTSYRPMRDFVARHLLPRVDSRVVIAHAASYSNLNALLNRVLHDLDCTVVEPQHGTVHSEHFAYQFPEVCQQAGHASHAYLPDVLLTFGEQWERIIRVPYRCFTVGYAHLDRAAKQLRQSIQEDANRILIISQGIVTSQMVQIALRLAEIDPHRQIIFKLHPNEVVFTERYATLESVANVQVVRAGNVYELIAACRTIIGYSSTVLYEALAFGRKRIFVLDNDALDLEVGTRFQTVDQLVDLLGTPDAGYGEVDPAPLWADQPDARLRAFLAQPT